MQFLFAEAAGPTDWGLVSHTVVAMLAVMCAKGAEFGIKWMREVNSTSVVRDKLARGGEKAAFEYLESELKELRMQLVKVNSDHTQCLIIQTRLTTELAFARDEIAELQAWKSKRGGGDSMLQEQPKR